MQHQLFTSFAYFPRLGRILASVNAAVLLSFLISQDVDPNSPYGVHKSVDALFNETGLSYEAQRTARRVLRRKGILTESHRRLEHKIYYRVDRGALRKLIEENPPLHMSAPQVENQEADIASGNGESPSRRGRRALNGEHSSQAENGGGTVDIGKSRAELTSSDSQFPTSEVGIASRPALSVNPEFGTTCWLAPHVCVDWRALLLQLARAGYSTTAIERRIGIGHSTLMGWKNGNAQPSHPKGERLVAFWLTTLGVAREMLPMRSTPLSRAKVRT